MVQRWRRGGAEAVHLLLRRCRLQLPRLGWRRWRRRRRWMASTVLLARRHTPLTWRPLCARRRCSSRRLLTAITCRAKHRARVVRARVQAWERVRGGAGAGTDVGVEGAGAGAEEEISSPAETHGGTDRATTTRARAWSAGRRRRGRRRQVRRRTWLGRGASGCSRVL